MIDCDTSLIVSTLGPERNSVVARRWLGEQEPTALAISLWTDTEVASAMARKRRSGKLTQQSQADSLAVWRRGLRAGMHIADVRADDFGRAAELINAGQRGLRASDALHLAIAERHGWGMATLDPDLADAARAVGLDAPAILDERASPRYLHACQ